MIDIHSHLIYNVDDGVKELNEAVDILEEYSKIGITDIILTPHYIIDTKYTSNKIDNIEKLNNIKFELFKRNININVYLGNEVYIDDRILQYIKNNKMCTLNNSEYILIELPMSGNYVDYQEVFMTGKI